MSSSSRYRRSSTIRCNYISYDDPITNHVYKLPMVHVKLTHGSKSIKSVALVDSGATSNFLPREIAELLEISLTEPPDNAVGAGGVFKNIKSKIEKVVLVKGIDSAYDEFTNLYVLVPVLPDTLPYFILGRDSIFRRFDIKFQERQEKLTLKRH